MTSFFKKYPGWTLLVFLAMTQFVWFWAAPGNFKTTWSKNPLVAHIIKENALIQDKAKIVAISYYLPYFQYFAGIVAGSEKPTKFCMECYFEGKRYIFHTFYQKTVDLFPEVDAAHFLLAYCEYYLEYPDVAITEYEKSTDLDPYFFWSYYNLGVIYFKQGEYYKSAVALNKALSLRKEITLEILKQSPMYKQIWRYINDPPQVLEKNLMEGQKDAALLLAACFIKAKGFDQALKIIQTFGQGSPWHQELWGKLAQKAVSRQNQTNDIDRLIQDQIPVRIF